jgi:N-acetylglucosamine-6-phosphate deacetylase
MHPERNCLAGASLPLLKGIENMMNYAGCSLGDAVNLATRNVSRVLALDDRGRLSEGKRADLVLIEKKGNRLQIQRTYLKGRLIHPETENH